MSSDQKQPMAKEDRIALIAIFIVIAVVFLGILFGIKSLMGAAEAVSQSGFVAELSSGIGLKAAFLIGCSLSFVMLLVFALFAGDGIVGELGVMIGGFFLLSAFFTISLLLIL